MKTLFSHPVWAMAFRPFYALAALFGALSVLLWGFGYQGTAEMPSFYWHAHEMIWGYAGAVVVGFLLTAVATWTGQPPTRGAVLFGLAACWLLARAAVYFPGGAAASGVLGSDCFTCRIRRIRIIQSDIFDISVFAPRSSPFKSVDPREVFHKILLIHSPSGRERGEISPASAFGEA